MDEEQQVVFPTAKEVKYTDSDRTHDLNVLKRYVMDWGEVSAVSLFFQLILLLFFLVCKSSVCPDGRPNSSRYICIRNPLEEVDAPYYRCKDGSDAIKMYNCDPMNVTAVVDEQCNTIQLTMHILFGSIVYVVPVLVFVVHMHTCYVLKDDGDHKPKKECCRLQRDHD